MTPQEQSLIRGIVELLVSEFGTATTDCGGDVDDSERCSGCRHFQVCLNRLHRQTKVRQLQLRVQGFPPFPGGA